MTKILNHTCSQAVQADVNKDKARESVKNDIQVSRYISEGSPNTQPMNTKETDALKVLEDHQAAFVIKEAIKDDQSLTPVASAIKVTVKDGTITLDGAVSTDQQMNLATNTALALAEGEKVKNHIEVTHKKQ
ncbi:MAG: BON domain-containing protein [Candidatus Omnitrophica bacterium]|nr:BON domain-containing protein [Candidatus Omnitrophota bacterium]